ncbi:MAG: ABC transporter permease [Alistipes sp.]|nr:ABC transporter permease [Alistipes sp.]
MFDKVIVDMLIDGFWDSIYMTLVATLLAYVIGLPLGIILVVTDKDGIKPVVWLNRILGIIINILRSVPFLILLITIIPFTRWVVGTSIGTNATIVPLVVAAAPFVARVVESSLKEIDGGVIEAAQSMGTSTFQIIYKVLLPESLPSLIVGGALAVTTILSYSALAGFVGGGGLGDIAIRYGYNRYQSDIMLITVALLVVIVQVLQEVGMKLAKVSDRRKR